MVDSIEVKFDRLLLFLGVGLVDVVLGLNHLQNWLLGSSDGLQQGYVWMVVAIVARSQDVLVDLFEIRPCFA